MKDRIRPPTQKPGPETVLPVSETMQPDFSIDDVPKGIEPDLLPNGGVAITIRNPGKYEHQGPRFPPNPREGDRLVEGQVIGTATVPDNLTLKSFGYTGDREKYLTFSIQFKNGRWFMSPKLPHSVASILARCIAYETSLRGKDKAFTCTVSIGIQYPEDRTLIEDYLTMSPHFDIENAKERTGTSVYLYSNRVGTVQYTGTYSLALRENPFLPGGILSGGTAVKWLAREEVGKHIQHSPTLRPYDIVHGWATNWLHSAPWNRFPGKLEKKTRFFMRVWCQNAK